MQILPYVVRIISRFAYLVCALLISESLLVAGDTALRPYHPPRVLFDETHNERNTLSPQRALQLNPQHPEYILYSVLQQALSYDYQVSNHTSGSITSQVLSSADVLVLAAPDSPFTTAEIQAINSFVQSGGGLIFLGDAYLNTAINTLLSPLGLQFIPSPIKSMQDSACPSCFPVSTFVQHEAVGVNPAFGTNDGGSFSLSLPAIAVGQTSLAEWRSSSGLNTQEPGEANGPFAMIAVSQLGNGRIFAVSDNAFQDDTNKSSISPNINLFKYGLAWTLNKTTIARVDIDKYPTPTEFYSRYITTPVILNDSWVNVPSLWLRSNSFAWSVITGDAIPITQDSTTVDYSEVFFGSYGDLFGDGSLTQVQGSWVFSNPKNLPGSLHVIQLNDSGITKTSWTSIEGTTGPWIGDFTKTGKAQIFVPGFRDYDVIPTQSYLINFDKKSSIFTKVPVGNLTTSHNSFLGSWNNDDVPTVLASSYGDAGREWDIRNNQPVLYRADGTGGVTQTFLGKLQVTESSIAHADLNGDGIQDLITADTFRQLPNSEWVTDNASYVHYGSSDGSYKPTLLPDPYFQSAKYDGIDVFFGGAGNWSTEAQTRTHKIAILVRDINGDGKLDILISSMETSKITPYRVLQFLIQQADGTFKDETDLRLFNYDLRGDGSHQVFIEDINGDGFPDIILSDSSASVNGPPDALVNCATQGNDVLLNDGEGYFMSVMKDSFCKFAADPVYITKFNPWFNKKTRKLGFVEIIGQHQTDGSHRYTYTQAVAKAPLYTGPSFSNPAASGTPGFNEWYYLLHYPDAKAAVDTGQYNSGLAHYLAEGKKKGYEIFAPNATIVGSDQVDTLVLNGNRSNFILSPISSGYELTDTVGRYGKLKLQDIERVQFSDALLNLSDGSVVLRGDINSDMSVNLADVVLSLQVMAGMSPHGIVSNYTPAVDVNGNGKFGLEEVIYILQKAAGSR